MEELQNSLEDAVQQCCSNCWDKAKDSLKKVLGNEMGLRNVSAGTFLQSMNEILKIVNEKLTSSAPAETQKLLKECLADCFRALRQACALNPDLRSSISSCSDLLANTKLVVEQGLAQNSDLDEEGVLKCAIQFLGNSCVQCPENVRPIWNTFLSVLRSLLLHPDIKLCDYTCMLVHTCLSTLAKQDQAMLSATDAQDIVLSCIQATTQRDIEWGLYVLEDMLKNDLFLKTLYHKMGHQERLLLMEVMIAEMNEMREVDKQAGGDENEAKDGGQETTGSGSGSPVSAVSPANMDFMSADVQKECQELLKLKTPDTRDQEASLVVAKELEILGVAAAHHASYPRIQEDTDLLRCIVNLLHSINVIGKSGNNVFTKVEKASRMDEVDPYHPVYGLKKDLIKLIANMAYRNRTNQDLVRSLEGIPLLLDLTNIDCHNPFITQWVVLAIRNLLENNADNRAVMTGMSLQGLAGHMSTLREMGVHTELKGGKIVVKPVQPQKQNE